MALTMKAAVVEHFGKPLTIDEWAVRSQGAGQIPVKTEALGVCHTDLHAAQGDWPNKPHLPFIPRPEAVGLIAKAGSGVTIVKEGDRAVWLTVCAEAEFGGYSRNGGFAQYVPADPNYVADIPPDCTPKMPRP